MKRIRLKSSKRLSHFLFTFPSAVFYTVFFTVPVFLGIYYGMTDWNGVTPDYKFVGLKNFMSLAHNSRFWESMQRTFLYAFLLVIFVVIISLISALALNSIKRIKTLAKTVFFFPALISAVAVALIWDQLYYRMLPELWKMIPLPFLKQSPLASPKTALYGVLFVNVWQAVAMPTIIFLAGLQSVPENLYESAVMDGARTLDKFRYITLPYLIPTLTVNMVLTFRNGITAFDYAFALTNGSGGPARSTELVSLVIYQDGFQGMRFSLANAQACVLFLVVAVLSVMQIYLSNRKSNW